MNRRLLVRRGAAGVLAVALCGWLSTFSPTGGRIRLAAAESPVSEDPAEPHPARATPAPTPAPKPAPVPVADCGHQKCVALTFDDGPVPGTRKLLDILARRKVRATFFLVGQNAAAYPDLVRRERDAGHEIGNHSYRHADLGR